jgi:hypothetical protein
MLTTGTALSLLMATETARPGIATTSYPQDGTTYRGKSLKVNKCHWRRIEGATDGSWW